MTSKKVKKGVKSFQFVKVVFILCIKIVENKFLVFCVHFVDYDIIIVLCCKACVRWGWVKRAKKNLFGVPIQSIYNFFLI